MKKIIASLCSNIFVQGGILLTGTNIVTGFLNYIGNVLVGRLLGPEGYSEIAATFSYLVVLSLPVGIVTTILIQKLGEVDKPLLYSQNMFVWLKKQCATYWFWIIIPFFFIPFMPWLTGITPLAAYIIIPLVFLSASGAFYDGVFQGMHYFRQYSVANIVSSIIRLSGAVLLFIQKEVAIVLGFVSLATLLRYWYFHILLHRKYQYLQKHMAPKKIHWKHILQHRQLWYTSIFTTTLALINNIDIIMVKKLLDPINAGYYSSWAQYAKMMLYLLAPVVSVLYIFFSHKKNQLMHRTVLLFSVICMLIVGALTYVIYTSFSKEIILLLFGKQFLPVSVYLDWASYYGTGYVLMMILGYYFLAKKSKAVLIPLMVLPIYIGALISYSTDIGTVMVINTYFVYICVLFYLLVLLVERLIYLKN